MSAFPCPRCSLLPCLVRPLQQPRPSVPSVLGIGTNELADRVLVLLSSCGRRAARLHLPEYTGLKPRYRTITPLGGATPWPMARMVLFAILIWAMAVFTKAAISNQTNGSVPPQHASIPPRTLGGTTCFAKTPTARDATSRCLRSRSTSKTLIGLNLRRAVLVGRRRCRGR